MTYDPLTSDAYFHIYNRGNNREDIFREEINYSFFLNLMKRHIADVSDVLSYCLLKNHFHLLIRTKDRMEDGKISQKFSNFFNAYAKAFNKRYDRNGSLFKDRFSRKRIDNEAYLKELILYIHLNPVHHGFIENFETYSHSSYKSLISDKPTLLDRDFVLVLFDDIENFKWVHRSKVQELDKEIVFE